MTTLALHRVSDSQIRSTRPDCFPDHPVGMDRLATTLRLMPDGYSFVTADEAAGLRVALGNTVAALNDRAASEDAAAGDQFDPR